MPFTLTLKFPYDILAWICSSGHRHMGRAAKTMKRSLGSATIKDRNTPWRQEDEQ